MDQIFIVPVVYILGHTPGGYEVDINTDKIISVHRRVTDEKNKLLTDTVKCVIHTEDGKFISVIESCKEIRRLIEQQEKKP